MDLEKTHNLMFIRNMSWMMYKNLTRSHLAFRVGVVQFLASDFKERRLEMKGKPYDMYQVNGNKHVKILLELT